MNNIYAETYTALLDKESQQHIINNPEEYAQSLGMDIEGKEVMVVVCDKNTLYVPLSKDKGAGMISHAELDKIQAAGATSSTVGSAGTLSSVFSAPVSLSTFASTSSAGSVGSAG